VGVERHWNRRKAGASRRTGTRGTASVEAVVALPVLLLLFISVFYVRDNALALQSAANQARTCAWLYSAANCPEDPSDIPAACQGAALSVDPDVVDRPELPETVEPITSAIDRLLGVALEAAFGKATTVVADKSFSPPALYGGGTKVVHRNYHLACNIQKKDLGDVVLEAWRSVYDAIF
jgi:hypothetical protein